MNQYAAIAGPEDYEPLEPLAPADPTVTALNRIAAALEQLVRQPAAVPQQIAAPRPLAALPPVVPQVQQVAQGAVCPIHNQPWRMVPGGISKKTGKPYDAFYACQVQGCDQRPPR